MSEQYPNQEAKCFSPDKLAKWYCNPQNLSSNLEARLNTQQISPENLKTLKDL